MQKYPVRASHRAGLGGPALDTLLQEHFGTAVREGDKVRTSFGALVALVAWADGKDLAVEVTMNPKVDLAVAAETVRRYNRFLEAATGFTTKERASRLRKSASKGAA
ncbi:MAG: DUF5611 family protein [Thermoplasmata archaeon]